MTQDIRRTVRTYIEQTFLLGAETPLGDSDSLLASQLVDSTGFLEIVAFIESTFAIKVKDDEMIPENLETIENIDTFVRSKLAS